MARYQHVRVATGLLAALVVGAGLPQSAWAAPPGVGQYREAHEACDRGEVLGWYPHPLAPVFSYLERQACNDAIDALSKKFEAAFDRSMNDNVWAGTPVNDVHEWGLVWIQDFYRGDWGDGAIISGRVGISECPEAIDDTYNLYRCAKDAHYVGGGAWNAYKRAANDYGVWPGYPINAEHNWGNVRIQDFREGAWGDGAIIGGGNAELVAGNHWEAYKRADGWNRLGNPHTFVNQEYLSFQVLDFDGGYWVEGNFWVQYFDGGQIWESDGTAYVFFYDTGLVERVL